jgi:hypothetical protein
MYTLYFLASITTFYYLYNKIKKLFAIKNHTFDDLTININSTKFDFLDITYEDYTREFIEDLKDFKCVLNRDKSIKYVTINYSVDSKPHSILFNKEHLVNLSELEFPFYDNIVKMPLYREVEKAVIFTNDTEYDITNILLEFTGPKLNYHSDIVKLRFEEIIDYSQEFPELSNVSGTINIDDNFGDKHIYNYPGEFIWKENLLD